MKDRLVERSEVPPATFVAGSLLQQHFKGLALETRYGAIDQEKSTFQLCTSCSKALQGNTDKPPRFALANFLSRGAAPPELCGLTWAERRLIGLFRANMYLLTIQGTFKRRFPDTAPVRSTSELEELDCLQWKLKGHCLGLSAFSFWFQAE